jgi:hypothetical protein
VSITGEEGDPPKLLPTHFILTENGKLVVQYRITERPIVEAISAVFLFPRNALQESSVFTVGALNARTWKRTSDLWAVMSYGQDAGAADEAPRYMPTIDAITAALTTPGKRPESSDLWTSIWRAVRAENAPARGKRHLIVMSDQDQQNGAGDGLISAVVAARVTVQVISTARAPRIEEFCRRVRGSFQLIECPDSVPEAVSDSYLNLLARYEISYQSGSPEPETLRIRVHSPAGWAETDLAIR